MADKQPIGYKITCENGTDYPRTRFLVPPSDTEPREDQFYAIAGGDEYAVRLMRPEEIEEYRAHNTIVANPEAVAMQSGHSDFTATMLRSMGLTCRAICDTAEERRKAGGMEIAG